MMRLRAALASVVSVLLIGTCVSRPTVTPGATAPPGPRAAVVGNPCSGTYPSYWQDARFAPMWEGQTITNRPPAGWRGPVFRLSDRFPEQPVDDSGAQPWRADQYDALFSPQTSQDRKTELARNYIWALMRYIQEGNIDSGNIDTDWDVCRNRVRNWYHIPFQTYDALSGREFVHGLTREAPVTFSLQAVKIRAAATRSPPRYGRSPSTIPPPHIRSAESGDRMARPRYRPTISASTRVQ